EGRSYGGGAGARVRGRRLRGRFRGGLVVGAAGGLAAAIPGPLQIPFPQLIIQGMPKASTSMPQRRAQQGSGIGICTVPPSASERKTRSASSVVSGVSSTEKP